MSKLYGTLKIISDIYINYNASLDTALSFNGMQALNFDHVLNL